jgi:hypothetical protein
MSAPTELRVRCGRISVLPDLLEEYDLACEAAAHWSKIYSQAGRVRAEECRVLALEIEQEIDDAMCAQD